MVGKRVGESERGEGNSWLLGTVDLMKDARQPNVSDMSSGDRCCQRSYESHLRASLKTRNKEIRKLKSMRKTEREDARRRNSLDRCLSELPT